MGKSVEIRQVDVKRLVPYSNNAKIHSEEQIDKIVDSIEEFGFISPILIDEDNNIIAGHGRLQAAKKIGLTRVPCILVEGLSEEQRRAYILADNKLTELGEWDNELIKIELSELQSLDFDISLTGFDFSFDNDSWFENRKEYDNSNIENESEEYQAFVEKFQPKRTTDDCYTPNEIFDVVANWVESKYGYDKSNIIRPFYPGGDYQSENYEGKIVVDNPPYSIVTQICQWYGERNIKFFLFCPALTCFAGVSTDNLATRICVNARITYENGACVPTGFITNMEDETLYAKTEPLLWKQVEECNFKLLAQGKRELYKIDYPDSLITAANMCRLSKYGVDFAIPKSKCVRVSKLDNMSETQIYGGGLLLSEKTTKQRVEAEKAADKAKSEKEVKEEIRIVAELSDREKEIIKSLD